MLNKEIIKLKKGDVLFYVDGRSGLSRKKVYQLRNKFFKISWINKFLKDTKKDILVWRMDHNIEKSWTTGDIMDVFNLNFDSDFAKSGQYSATFFAIRVSENTINFIEKWFQTMNKYITFSRDEISIKPNHKTFNENRYDQSFFSLILKINEKNLNIQEITNHDIFDKQTIIPHMKSHPK